MQQATGNFRQKDFWLDENLRYAEPYFRLEKCARIVNHLTRGRNSTLLDIGCGPATLARLLDQNIQYFGIDIAIHTPAPNLREFDFARQEIRFDSKEFDIVVAAGVFEYLGTFQNAKFLEIQRLLKKDGRFVTTFTNFKHINDRRIDHSLYNNIKPVTAFKSDLESYFRIDKWFPSSHNWFCSEPRRGFLRQIQMPLQMGIPILTPLLAVNYFFICSSKDGGPI
jgi:SAM-dependent methyltransferase